MCTVRARVTVCPGAAGPATGYLWTPVYCGTHQSRAALYDPTHDNDQLLTQDRRGPFFKSHCWEKLKAMVFCAVSWNGKHNVKSELLEVTSFDFLEDDNLIKEIETDYEFIRNKLNTKGFSALTGKDGKWIQARTKGAGHGSKSRAFYARKTLIKEIIKL